MPSATPQTQPQLKKKASFRERLKAWQKPPQPLELVAEESKPRFVYEPRHAAADFSRLAVSPLSPSRQRLASPMQRLADDDATFVRRTSQSRSRHGDENRVKSPRDEQSDKGHSRSGANRHSYTLVEDPFHDSNAAAHVPIQNQPVTWSLGAQPATLKEEQPPRPSAAQPLSDYELFIARAEAEERARHEQVLRSISQRSAAYSAGRVKPDPHRQFATTAGSSSAERSHRPTRHDSGSRRYVPGSGREEQPPPPPQKPSPEQQQQQQRQGGHQRRGGGGGHARQSSWAPSYTTTGGSAAERVLEGSKSPASHPQPQPQQQQRQPPPPEIGIVPPRTLRRQASLTQRIAQYIRPPKESRVKGPVEALVE
jgi:hypothetical protein